jgi:nucleotidyltransferase substrate binding protein (TIGR01987 family)
MKENEAKKLALLAQFERTVANLKEVLERIAVSNEKDHAVFRDSAIQRFEIAFDTCWKTIREKLKAEYGTVNTVAQTASSPKKIFQEAFRQGIIENDVLWLDMTDMRNETTHAYNEAFSEEVLSKLPAVLTAFEILIQKLKN